MHGFLKRRIVTRTRGFSSYLKGSGSLSGATARCFAQGSEQTRNRKRCHATGGCCRAARALSALPGDGKRPASAGKRSRAAALPLPLPWKNLQPAGWHGLDPSAQAGTTAALQPSLDRQDRHSRCGTTMRHRQEHGISLASPLSRVSRQPSRRPRRRRCRGGRNLLPPILQGAARAAASSTQARWRREGA